MRKSKWPPEKTALLLAMVNDGLCRREIAACMGLGISAVTAKLCSLHLDVPLTAATVLPRAARANRQCLHALSACPRFEDVTPAEARAIAAGAPPSAPFARCHDFSIIGNAAALCVAF